VRDHDTVILGGLIYSEKDKRPPGSRTDGHSAVGLSVSQFERLGHAQRTDRVDSPDGVADAGDCGAGGDGGENKMPGVRATEKEVREDEQRRLKQMDKANLYQPMEKP